MAKTAKKSKKRITLCTPCGPISMSGARTSRKPPTSRKPTRKKNPADRADAALLELWVPKKGEQVRVRWDGKWRTGTVAKRQGVAYAVEVRGEQRLTHISDILPISMAETRKKAEKRLPANDRRIDPSIYEFDRAEFPTAKEAYRELVRQYPWLSKVDDLRYNLTEQYIYFTNFTWRIGGLAPNERQVPQSWRDDLPKKRSDALKASLRKQQTR